MLRVLRLHHRRLFMACLHYGPIHGRAGYNTQATVPLVGHLRTGIIQRLLVGRYYRGTGGIAPVVIVVSR
jgi:uncharacterized Fe-S cluster-containing radical SAM superfamily enzyme